MLRDHELHSLQRFGASGAHSGRLRRPAARLLNVNVTQTGYGDVEVTETGVGGGGYRVRGEGEIESPKSRSHEKIKVRQTVTERSCDVPIRSPDRKRLGKATGDELSEPLMLQNVAVSVAHDLVAL